MLPSRLNQQQILADTGANNKQRAYEKTYYLVHDKHKTAFIIKENAQQQDHERGSVVWEYCKVQVQQILMRCINLLQVNVVFPSTSRNP